jgi:hypothetical protein
MRAPALVGSLLVLCFVPQARAQDAADTTALPGVFFAPPRPRLVLPPHPAFAPGGRYGPRATPAAVAAAWAARVRARLATVSFWSLREAAPPGLAAEPPPPADAPAAPAAPQIQRGTGPFGQYADLGMRLNVRFELKADQFKNLRCTAAERLVAFSGCSPGFPTITPVPQYQILTSGVVGQRLHLNVDFDSEREFDANNNLQVWYEGLEDEILRRVEAGNVTFQAPPSRFISAAIPANNFGVQAIAQLGPLELRGIYAQQKGNVVKDRVYSIGDVTTQPLDREVRDLDYEPGRFFFAIDPLGLPEYPAVDVLALGPATVPDSLRVGNLRVYRVRALAPTSTNNQNLGGVRAVACGADGAAPPPGPCPERAGPFQWEILVEGRDYYVDPTGAWFALSSRIAPDDYLAVSYIPAGQTDCGAGNPRPCVGTFPVSANPDTGRVDTLRLVYDPRPGVTAASRAFRFEIRAAYRVGGSELARESVELTLAVNERERSLGTGQTYLELLGLAVPTDATRFDQYNRLFPRDWDPQQGAPLRDRFVVFPHLTPLADATRLAAAERNDSLYRTPRTLLATQGPPSVFALRLHASVSASSDRSVLSLNSFQIREGSEKLYLGTTLLLRDVDYLIDYATGQVQFRNPDSLFQAGAAQIRAQFEERAAFVVAPTAIYGLSARYDLGARGHVSWTGLFQREQSAFTRPPLGFEPASSFIGGVSTELRFQPAWLTALVDALPGVRTAAPSFLNVSAELALSRPEPNALGQAYLEEFEGEAGRLVPLQENAWRWGSVPSSPRGAEPFLAPASAFDPLDLAALTWQNLPLSTTHGFVQFLPQQIDPTIRVSGQGQTVEPVLWLVLKPDTVLGLAHGVTGAPNWVRPPRVAPRWRSITQSLAATGIDLSRTEFLEFWVWEDQHRLAKANRAALIIDFGSVFEDAAALVPEAFRAAGSDTTYYGARLAGAGRLDTERDPVTRSWNAADNDHGILTDRVVEGILDSASLAVVDTLPLCSARRNGQLQAYFLGDLRSRCGRGNGFVDTEDLDGDFLLDVAAGVRTQEDVVRFVFPIGDERFYVRDGVMTAVTDSTGTGTVGWRLYRIPFRADTLQIGQPNLRQVQALRLTVVAPQTAAPDPQLYFALARVRLVGSSWLKRAETPIPGVAGDRGTGVGEVIASVVSTENRDLGYTPPPGVFDAAGRRDAGLQVGVTQINERSLRLLARGLGAGERAEAYLRFTSEGDKNFLKYRRLRVWARGRGPGWDDGDLEFYAKVGKDADNFYLYHVPARTGSWEPEVVADFDRWLALRGRIEQAWLGGDTAQVYPGCPDTTVVPHTGAYVMCDGPYLVHVRDPGTAPPNLARVQEIAAGMLRMRTAVFIDQAELWVDDIRLSDVVEDVGVAGALDVTVAAADVADAAFSLSRRDGRFRQLGDDPTYVTDQTAVVGGTVRLDRLLPDAWGLAAPLTVRRVATSSDPFYLNRSDLRADALAGVRTPHATATSYALTLRRTRRSQDALGRWLLDPLSASGSYTRGGTRADFSNATSSGYGATVDYNLVPAAVTTRVAGLALRLTPVAVRLRSGVNRADAERFTFGVPVARPADSLVAPAVSRSHVWRNSGSIDLAPLTGLQLRIDGSSLRDLREYDDSTTVGRLAGLGRRSLLGVDVGLEAQRTLGTLVAYAPPARGWLRPRATLGSTFALRRDPTAREPVREIGDTAGAFRIPTAFSNTRRIDLGAQLDAGRLGRSVFGDSAAVARLLGRITGTDVSVSRTLASSFNRAAFEPGTAYQLAWGGTADFRRQAGLDATSASDNTSVAAAGAAGLPGGFRLASVFRRTSGTSWVLRTDRQVPVRSSSREWPSGSFSWTTTPSRNTLTSLTAQLGFRETEIRTEQPSFAGTGSTTTRTTVLALSPGVTMTWVGGLLTAGDATVERSEQLAAGNLFRSERAIYNVNVGVVVRVPTALARLPMPIRATARFSNVHNTTCLQSVGQTACVPFVDSRQTQAQITLDTDFPPNVSAGFQMAYVVNEERQASRKIRQIVVTAFVNLSTAVGQLR